MTRLWQCGNEQTGLVGGRHASQPGRFYRAGFIEPVLPGRFYQVRALQHDIADDVLMMSR